MNNVSQRVFVRVASAQPVWPKTCPCCGGEATSTTSIGVQTTEMNAFVTRTASYSQEIPYCAQCLQHVESAGLGAIGCLFGAVLFLGWIAFAGGLVAYFWNWHKKPAASALWITGCVLLPATFVSRQMNRRSLRETQRLMRPTCSSAEETAVRLQLSNAGRVYLFSSPDYAEAFLLANQHAGIEVERLADYQWTKGKRIVAGIAVAVLLIMLFAAVWVMALGKRLPFL